MLLIKSLSVSSASNSHRGENEKDQAESGTARGLKPEPQCCFCIPSTQGGHERCRVGGLQCFYPNGSVLALHPIRTGKEGMRRMIQKMTNRNANCTGLMGETKSAHPCGSVVGIKWFTSRTDTERCVPALMH